MQFFRVPATADLPLMPTPRARGMVLLWNPDADLRDFLAVIEGDPGLTASVLRAANSAYSSPLEPTTTARTAIVRVGLEGARQITVAALASTEFGNLEESGLDAEAVWRWLLAVGILTEAFATHDGAAPDELMSAFTAGLLHQMGRLAYASLSPSRYRHVIELIHEGQSPADAEREVFGAESSDLNAQIAQQWALPSPLLEAVAPSPGEEPGRIALLIQEAREVARLLQFDEGFARLEVLSSDPLVSDPLAPVQVAEEHPRAAMIEALGGATGVREQISWFRHATAPRDDRM